MSVLVTLRVPAKGDLLEQAAKGDADLLAPVVVKAKAHGLIAHHFWASQNEILVVDEWPDEASFQAFFEASPEIAGIMAKAGATGEPQVEFWRKLDVGDDVG